MPRKQNRIVSMDGSGRTSRSAGRWWLWLLAALAIALIAAYVDGGEEPLRPISEPVVLPESK